MDVSRRTKGLEAKGRRGEIAPSLSIALLIILSAAITAVYVVVVKQITSAETSQQAVEKAARYAAGELCLLSMPNARLGDIGICDLPASGQHTQINGLNSLNATLRSNSLIIARLHLPYLKELLLTDYDVLRRLGSELSRMLQEAIEPNFWLSESAFGPSHSIYQTARKLAQGSGQKDESLIDMKITLGTIKASDAPTNTQPALSDLDLPRAYVVNGEYRSWLEMPLADSHAGVRFYPLAESCQLMDANLFRAAEKDTIPSAVLIEATYRTFDRRMQKPGLIVRKALALAGAPRAQSVPCVFLISFPQGAPPIFACLADVINYKKWQQRGIWQQAIAGNVPGPGRLATPRDIDFGAQDPSQAAAVLLYDWLRVCGAGVDPNAVAAMVQERWLKAGSGHNSSTDINSCLSRDTGQRSYAFSDLTSQGQEALRNAFAATRDSKVFPASALPLQIDAGGTCNLPSRQGFDRQLVADYLGALHDTNISAIESSALARTIVSRLDKANQEIDKELRICREELDSTNTGVERVQTQISGDESKLRLLRRHQNELTERLSRLHKTKEDYQAIRQRAEIVLNNADRTLQITLDLGANSKRYGADGLYYVEAPVHGFLLNKRLVFVPIVEPITESDIYHLGTSEEPGAGHAPSWCDPDFNALAEAPDSLIVEGRSLKDLKGEGVPVQTAPAIYGVFDSSQLKSGKPRLLFLDHSPFGSLGLTPDQLVFYAPNTVVSGQGLRVAWSVLLRDLVAFRGRGQGQPVASSEPRWCQGQEIGLGSCPKLAVELQLRAPVPLAEDLPQSAELRNPLSGETAAEIPPAPAQML